MDKLEDRKKEILIVVIVIGMIIGSLIAIYFYMPDDWVESGDDLPTIERNIEFPEDEGIHDDYFEVWEFFTTLKTGDEEEIHLLTNLGDFRQAENAHLGYEYIDKDNITAIDEHVINTQEASLSATEGDMDLEFSGSGTDTTITREENGNYSFTTMIRGKIELNLSIHQEKEPLLIGDEGKLYHHELGTLFGYHQTHLKISGGLYEDDVKIRNVTGEGWLEHIWGGDIKSMSKEEWQIHLDNSVDIFITKAFEPGEEYPNDLFFHNLNIVGKGGDIKTPRLGDEIFMSYEEYKIVPDDDSNKRAWSYKWTLYNKYMNLTFYPSPARSIHEWTYLGFIKVEGEYYGESVSGYGICELNKRYISEPNIEEVTDDFNSLKPKQPVNVYTNISYMPPIEPIDIVLEYRINEGAWEELEMSYNNSYWEATIPAQDYNTKVEYRINITDQADKTVESDIYEYYVEIV